MGQFSTKLVHLTDVVDRQSGELVPERVPSYLKTLYASVYETRVGRKLATSGAMQRTARRLSKKVGADMDTPESSAKVPAFVAAHKINTAEFSNPDLSSFATFNEFFSRQLRPGARPIASPEDARVFVSPADCRIMVFPTASACREILIKGQRCMVDQLCDGNVDLKEEFRDCAVAVCRLAPQDYHRWHMPMGGTFVSRHRSKGTLLSVSPTAVRHLEIFGLNDRESFVLDSKSNGRVLMVAVGAALVGAIVVEHAEGDKLAKGDEHGYFRFGGSTVVLLISNPSVAFDDDLLANSRRGLETLVRMGERIATFESQDLPTAGASASDTAGAPPPESPTASAGAPASA